MKNRFLNDNDVGDKNDKFVLKNGAILIADAHENGINRTGFWDFLLLLESEKIKCKQLFLMGDIFDLLVGGVEKSVESAKKYIDLLDKLGLKIEIFYIEGNHDFNLKKLFKNVKIFPINSQPITFISQNFKDFQNIQTENIFCTKEKEKIRKIKLAHGDIFLPKFLQFILGLLRNKWLIKILNFIDKLGNFWIFNSIMKKQLKKNIFYKINDFENLANARFREFESDIVIEGHFHQGVNFDFKNGKYFNLESFAQKNSYFIVEYSENFENFTLLKESARRKDV